MFINWATNEITLKIVYYGPGLGGKTTSLQYIYRHLDPSLRGNLVTLNTREDRTLFFDFLQLDFGKILHRQPRFNLYTVPGQVYYAESRRIILSGVDGIVFVADAQKDRMDDNLESLLDLEQNLIAAGKTLQYFPWVLQINKVDLPNREHPKILTEKLNYFGVPQIESVATEGIGIMQALKLILSMVVKKIQEQPQTQHEAKRIMV